MTDPHEALARLVEELARQDEALSAFRRKLEQAGPDLALVVSPADLAEIEEACTPRVASAPWPRGQRA